MADDSDDELEKAMLRKVATLQRTITDAQRQLAIFQRALNEVEELRKSERKVFPQRGKPLPPGVTMTWTDAAGHVLRDQGYPMTPLEMVPFLGKYRSTDKVGKPSWLVSNGLRQKPDEYERVEWRGITRWWLKGRPLPPE